MSVFGVLGSDSLHIRTVDACNSKTFKGFLQDILRIYPKILLILDNASFTSLTPSPSLLKPTRTDSGWCSCPPTPRNSTR